MKLEESLLSYLPVDRCHALAAGQGMPDRVSGTALFADISGFVPLTGALAAELKGKRAARDLWVFSSGSAAAEASGRGFVDVIERAGARVFSDTCPVVAPLPERFGRVLTDSAKGCYYLRGAQGRRLRIASTAACIKAALSR